MIVRGTYDILPAKMRLYKHICCVFDRVCRMHGYEEVMTPILEQLSLFARTLGECSDVVSKEMFVVRSEKEEDTVLRPEGTAGVMRLFLDNFLQDTPKRLCYFGPMFRYERPQKGRYRQFYQFGVECIGVDHWQADVEAIQLAWRFIQGLNLQKNVRVEVNNIGSSEERYTYQQALKAYLLPLKKDLSPETCRRLEGNVLRALDSKDAGDKLILQEAPRIKDFLGDVSRRQFEDVCSALTHLKIPFVLNDLLVRGLDYYNHSVFEFVSDDLGAQSAILGGGRYDGLAKILNDKHDVCAVGWAAGIERIAALIEGMPSFAGGGRQPVVALIVFEESCVAEAYKYGHELHAVNVPYVVVSEGTLRKKMKVAARLGASLAILFGTNEMAQGGVLVRDMQNAQEDFVLFRDMAKFVESKYHASAC